jgi:hypothetical protein
MGKSLNDSTRWEEKNPSRCATHFGLARNLISVSKMIDVAVHTILEGFMQDGQRCDGLNERNLDWYPVQVVRECQLDWMKQYHCS